MKGDDKIIMVRYYIPTPAFFPSPMSGFRARYTSPWFFLVGIVLYESRLGQATILEDKCGAMRCWVPLVLAVSCWHQDVRAYQQASMQASMQAGFSFPIACLWLIPALHATIYTKQVATSGTRGPTNLS